MSDIDYKSIPALAEDQTLDSLMETFNARLLMAESNEHFVGNLTVTVKIGPEEFVTLPTVRLVTAANKVELERARATLFASYLMRQSREEARRLFVAAKQYEGDSWIAWVKLDVEWKKRQLHARGQS
jgi:hypothetical protein